MSLPANFNPEAATASSTGVRLLLTTSDPRNFLEIQRAPDVAGGPDAAHAVTVAMLPGTAVDLIDHLTADGTAYWYRTRQVLEGFSPSPWTSWVAASPANVLVESGFPAEVQRQHDTLYGDDGTLDEGVSILETGSQRVIAKGRIAGLHRNGDSILFAAPFSSTPAVFFRGGASYEPRSKWGPVGDGTETSAPTATPQYDDFAALNVTASGFTLRARLRQKGSPTARTDNFATGAMTSAADARLATIANAPASDDTYTAHYSITVTAQNDPGIDATITVTVALDSAPDGVTWTERATKVYSVTKTGGGTSNSQTWSTETQAFTVSGLTTGGPAKARLRIKSVVDSGASTFSLASGATLTYSTSATDQFASKTPDADDTIAWEALVV